MPSPEVAGTTIRKARSIHMGHFDPPTLETIETNIHDLVSLLYSSLKPNLGGIENDFLYSRTYLGTKKLVNEYYDCSVKAIHHIMESSQLNTSQKQAFLKRASKIYGRTGLCLSGYCFCFY